MTYEELLSYVTLFFNSKNYIRSHMCNMCGITNWVAEPDSKCMYYRAALILSLPKPPQAELKKLLEQYIDAVYKPCLVSSLELELRCNYCNHQRYGHADNCPFKLYSDAIADDL